MANEQFGPDWYDEGKECEKARRDLPTWVQPRDVVRAIVDTFDAFYDKSGANNRVESITAAWVEFVRGWNKSKKEQVK